MKYLKLLFIPLIFITASCNIMNKTLLKNGYEKTEIVKQQIEKIKNDYNVKIEQKEVEVRNKYEDIINKQNKNAQEANVNVYGIINLSGLKNIKERIDQLIEFKARAAFNLLPSLTPEQLIQENDNIRKELDETKTSLNDLQQKYSQIERENIEKRQVIDIAKQELEKLKEEKTQIEKDRDSKIIELQELRNKLNEQQLAIAAENERRLKEDQETKKIIAYASGAIGAILIIVGLAILKSPMLSFIGGGFIVFSLFVATAPEWVLWGIPSLLIIGGGIVLILKYKKEKILNDGNLRAIQRFKENSKEMYDKNLKPLLTDEHGQYDKNGNVIEDKRKAIEIDKRLMELNVK